MEHWITNPELQVKDDLIDVMDKIYLILQRGVKIHCGSLILIFGLYAGIPIFQSLFPCPKDHCGESHLIFFIITIFAAQGLFLLINWKWKRVSEEGCRAVLEEFNGKCEYQSTLYPTMSPDWHFGMNKSTPQYWARNYYLLWVAWNWVINLRFVHPQKAG